MYMDVAMWSRMIAKPKDSSQYQGSIHVSSAADIKKYSKASLWTGLAHLSPERGVLRFSAADVD